VRCSKGTYVRTLAHDLGEVLGCHAHLTALRRTSSAGFDLAQAMPLDALARMGMEGVRERLLSEAEALAFLPAVAVSAESAGRVRNGRPLGAAELPGLEVLAEGARLRLTGPGRELLAVAERRGAGARYVRVLAGRDGR
jgi:tRNA pseudouridine55 synthase